MNRLVAVVVLISLAAGLAVVPGPHAAACRAQAVALESGLERDSRGGATAVTGAAGVVVSASRPASEAGAAVLGAGGNAVDAAVATGFALAVTYPAAGNIGGGGFMVVRLPDGTATSFDFRETAPAAARPDMFLDAEGRIDVARIKAGYLAVGVPGTVSGFALAHARRGRLPWRDVVEPAVRLARDGFEISATLAKELNDQLAGPMQPFPGSVAAFGKPGGGAWQAGDRLCQADLAATLEAIAAGGPAGFYEGRVAGLVADAMAAHGGIVTRADLAGYRAKERPPLEGTAFGHQIISMGPPSSGGVALLEMLGMAEAAGIAGRPRLAADTIHLVTEIRRRAYLDRARFLGDPDFIDVPVARLVSPAHARELVATIDPRRATPSVELGGDLVMPDSESDQTTHYSVVDEAGMAVATTTTLEASYGSRVVAPGTGFLLNNEMGDFNRSPGRTTTAGDIGTPANLIAPGKRMLSSMTPTIVCRDGRLVLVTGSPGGRTIINTVFDVVMGVVAHGADAAAAVAAPRFHHQWLPDQLMVEAGGVSAETKQQLERLGQRVVERSSSQGSAQTIWIDAAGVPHGIADLRDPDAAAAGRAAEPSAALVDDLPAWTCATEAAAWQPRDSQGELVFGGRMWMFGGWFNSRESPPRDVWSSADGRAWTLVQPRAAWRHSDLPMTIVFRGRMWLMGGWVDGRLPTHSASSAVWSSADGIDWREETPAAGWSPRLAAGLVEFKGRLWILGGTENYYFGDAASLKNDVWSSADGITWRRETESAGWAPRAYHQAAVFGDRIYVCGGGNYVPEYRAHNDVWSSADGVTWRRETEAAPWHPRLWFSTAVYRDRLWLLGGWSDGPSRNWNDVWHTRDGREWQRLDTPRSWSPRHEHSTFVFEDRLWVAGGMRPPLSNEVWSLHLPVDWRP